MNAVRCYIKGASRTEVCSRLQSGTYGFYPAAPYVFLGATMAL